MWPCANASRRAVPRGHSARVEQAQGRDRQAARGFAADPLRYPRREAGHYPDYGAPGRQADRHHAGNVGEHAAQLRSEEHTSELQSLIRISYAVLCLNKKKITNNIITTHIKKTT